MTLVTALKPAVMRSGRPLQYPGMEVKQFVSWRPCLTYSPVESVWLVAIGVNGFFVATAYVNTLFVSSIAGGMCMSTVLVPPFGGMSLFVGVTMALVKKDRMSPTG